jgi:hypothetical protein
MVNQNSHDSSKDIEEFKFTPVNFLGISKENPWYIKQLINIRYALKIKIASGIKRLVEITDSIIPLETEKQKWYITILIRPTNIKKNMNSLENFFSPIFFAEYKSNIISAYSDWEDNPTLISQLLYIDKCCAGLPILWNEYKSSWKEDQNFFICKEERGHIRYFALKNVKTARFSKNSGNNLIKEKYATDNQKKEWKNHVGWQLKDINNGKTIEMSQNIETVILIPIYDPFLKDNEKQIILGIVNFEWDEHFDDERIHKIGTLLSKIIIDQNLFVLSRFICDILPNLIINN